MQITMNEKKNTSSETMSGASSETLPAAGASVGAAGNSGTPVVRRLGRGTTRLSGAAEAMVALNRLPLAEKTDAVKRGRITAAQALAGSDELAGEAGRLLHAVALRPLEMPERRTHAFSVFDEAQGAPKDAEGGQPSKPLLGLTLAVAGTVDVEGVTPLASSELLEEPSLRCARPLAALERAGAVVAALAWAGELGGLISPDAPARTIKAGSPVNPIHPKAPSREDTPMNATAAVVAAGAAGAGLFLGRGSDAAKAAVSHGLASFRASPGIFTSIEGFVPSWRFGGWGVMARSVADAAKILRHAAADEGVNGQPGRGAWAFPGYRPLLLGQDGVEQWIEEMRLPTADVPLRKVLFAVGAEWKTSERLAAAERIAAHFHARGIETGFVVDLPDEAPIVDWMTWAELEPAFEDFLCRHFPLHTELRTDQFLMALTLGDRIKRDGWDRRRFVSLIRHAPEMLSPWGPQIAREELAPLRDRIDRLFIGQDHADALIWFGGSAAVDCASGPVVGVPLLDDRAAEKILGAFVTGPMREDVKTRVAAEMLEDAARTLFGPLDLSYAFAPVPEAEAEAEAASEGAPEAAPVEGVPDEETPPEVDAVTENLTRLLEHASQSEAESGEGAAAGADWMRGFPKDPAARAAALGDAVTEKAQADFLADMQKFLSSVERLIDEVSESDETEGGGVTLLKGPDAPDDEPEEAGGSLAKNAAAQPLSPEDAQWFAAFFPGCEKKHAGLAKLPFLRAFLKVPMADHWEPSDAQYLLEFSKYWLGRRSRRRSYRVLEHIPAQHRTFAVGEGMTLALLLNADPKPALELARSLVPTSDEEDSTREWLLGMATERSGDKAGATAHFRRACEVSPTPECASVFPLAHLILRESGPENEEYQLLKARLKTMAPSGYQLLLAEEERLGRRNNFERELLPALTPGVFHAVLLLPATCLELRKDAFSDELSRAWGLMIRDRSPEDPDRFTFRVGFIEGEIVLTRGRINDASLAQAARRNVYTREAEALFVRHEGAIDLSVRAGTADPKDAASLYAQILAALCRTNEPLGVHALGVLEPPGYYVDAARPLKEGEFPSLCVVSAGLREEMGEHFIATYGLGSLGRSEMEINIDGLMQPAANLLAFGLIDRMINGDLSEDATAVRFGPDQENLTELRITRAPGRHVDGEVVLFSLKPDPADAVPQA